MPPLTTTITTFHTRISPANKPTNYLLVFTESVRPQLNQLARLYYHASSRRTLHPPPTILPVHPILPILLSVHHHRRRTLSSNTHTPIVTNGRRYWRPPNTRPSPRVLPPTPNVFCRAQCQWLIRFYGISDVHIFDSLKVNCN